MHYTGNTKLIKKHLGFLETEYEMNFAFQTFEEYNNFSGPVDTYSFYNKFGCFTLHNIVQKGEWGWFISKNFSTNQYELLDVEVIQSNFIKKRYCFYSSILKELALIIKKQIKLNNHFFNIKLE